MSPDPWFTATQAGLIGGIGGSLIGIAGALCGWLASRGRGRSVVTTIAWTMLVLGAILLGLGIAALAAGQPYAVYYPLLLLGVFGVVFGPLMLRVAARRYTELELRRLESRDLEAR